MRWDGQKSVDDLRLPGLDRHVVTHTFDAPEAMGVTFHEVNARSGLNKVPRGSFDFAWTINPYRGCTHACVYCLARGTHPYLGLGAGRDFEREIIVKVNLPELVRAEVRRPGWRGEAVALGTNTDPYQWCESRYRLLPGILEALLESRTPASILTKSPLVLRDIEIFEEFVSRGVGLSVNLSVPTLEEKAWRETEPHTPSPRARLEAVAELRARGIESGVFVAPLMPGINDAPAQIAEIEARAREAGASFLCNIPLYLQREVKDVFLSWLDTQRPELADGYRRSYAGRAFLRPDERRRVADRVPGWGRERLRRDHVERAVKASGRKSSPRSRHGNGRDRAPDDADLGQTSLF